TLFSHRHFYSTKTIHKKPPSDDIAAILIDNGQWDIVDKSSGTKFNDGDKLWLNLEDFLARHIDTGGKEWMEQISPLNLKKPYFNEGADMTYDRTFFTKSKSWFVGDWNFKNKFPQENWKDYTLWADDASVITWKPKRELSKSMRERNLKELYQAWAKFADKHRIPYWLAHSSLLGWWWAQEPLPWKESIQVQTPTRTLELLWRLNGDRFSPTNNFFFFSGSRFVLDVSPFIHIRQSQPHNAVDARFIDTKTGMFIDISAFTSVPWIPGHIETKKPVESTIHHIRPLRRTTFCDAPAWIPATAESILEKEFGYLALTRTSSGSYRFEMDLKKWMELDCTALFEVYVKGAGTFVHRRIKVDWARNSTHCIVQLHDKNPPENLQLKHEKEIIISQWVLGILVEMLRKVQPPGRWKILVVDAEALKIINSVCRMSDILNENVKSVEDITRRRQPYPENEAIYFVGPSNDSIQLIIDDFKNAKPLYVGVHIFCTAALPDRLFDKIKNSPVNNFMKRLVELNVDFIVPESHVFSLDNPTSMHAIYNAPTASHLDFELKSLATRITSVLATLGEYPYIRYHDPNGGSRDKPNAAKLAALVKSELDNLRDHDSSFPSKTSSPATLIILDRSIDVIAPLLHEHTYQAMAQDLVVFDNGKYTPNDTDDKTPEVIDESDVIWAHTRHWHIADVMEFLADVVQKFITTNKAANWEMSKGESDSSIDKLQQMKDTMAALPQYQEIKKKFSLHTSLCQEVMAVYKRRQLDRVAKVEQDFATDLDNRSTKISMLDLDPLLKDKNVRYLDKIRLLMLYIISQEGIQEADRQRLFEVVQLGREETQAVNNLSLLGVRLSASMEKRKTERGRYTYGGAIKEKEEPKYDTMKYTPVLKYVMEDQVKGTIDSNFFPWLKEPPPDYSGFGTRSGRLNSTVPSTIERQTKPSWATRKATAVSSQIDLYSSSNRGGEDDKNSMTVESLMASAKGGIKSEDLLKNGPRVIIFVIGGITFSEMRACAEITKKETREVIIGSTHICNPKDFLDILKTLHKANAASAAATSATPRMPGCEVLSTLLPPPSLPPTTRSPDIGRSTSRQSSRSEREGRTRQPPSRQGSSRSELSDTRSDRQDDIPKRSKSRGPASPRMREERRNDRDDRDYHGSENRGTVRRDNANGYEDRSRNGHSDRNPERGYPRDDRPRDERVPSNRMGPPSPRNYSREDLSGPPRGYKDDRGSPIPRDYRDENRGAPRNNYGNDRGSDRGGYSGSRDDRNQRGYRDDRGYSSRDGRDRDGRDYDRGYNQAPSSPSLRNGDTDGYAYKRSGIESGISRMRMDGPGGPDPYRGNSDSKEMSKKDNDSSSTSSK
ncbi:vacuolar sorting protein VPS33/slp1, partial [Nowakowskiella sp. JEL0078]